jgi:hypothetical protein
MKLEARNVAIILGGDVTGPDTVNVPGPGHSSLDRSLSIKIDERAPGGFVVFSHAGGKSTSKGLKRTGQCFEFGAHRTGAVVALLFEVQDVLIALSAQGGAS